MQSKIEPQVRISQDALEAVLVAAKGTAADVLAPMVLLEKLKQAGVVIDAAVTAAVVAFSSASIGSQVNVSMVVAKAKPGVPGEAGNIEFVPGMDPRKLEMIDAVTVEKRSEAISDHYAGRAYCSVKVGTRIGTMIAPKAGIAGKDVCGGAMLCMGAASEITLGPSLQCGALGAITATTDGILVLNNGTLTVSRMLEIAGCVDFKVGHIELDGDVLIGQGVKPGFKVHATGMITISGLVEGCDIDCGKDLKVDGGIVGNGGNAGGSLRVSGNAAVRYADGVCGTIEKSLRVESELTNSTLTVGENFDATNASVFGGELTITGSCRVKSLGSEGFKPTLLVLGDVPLYVQPRRKLAIAVAMLDTKIEALAKEEKLILINPRPRASDRERLTEYAFEVSELTRERKNIAEDLAKIDAAIATRTTLNFEVTKEIYPKVRIRIGAVEAEFTKLVKGPVQILWDEQKNLVCKVGSALPVPLSSMATIRSTQSTPVATGSLNVPKVAKPAAA